MTHRMVTTFFVLAALGAPVFAAEKALPVCTVKALTRLAPRGARYEIGLLQPGDTQPEPLQRVRSLAEAIHFVKAERRHHTCRPAFPSERRNCAFTTVNRQLVMSYSGQGAPLEPVASFSDQRQANLVLRQMRNAYLCN